jgi:protein-S-isoprenylcysteine O-methyltransferase Ste14
MSIYLTLGLWSIFIIYWLIAARNNSQTSFSSEIFSFLKLIGSALLIYLPLLTGGILAARLYPSTIWFNIAGIIACTAGVCLAIWSRIVLGKNWSGRVMLQKAHQLVQDGPYGLVRHPIYLGCLLAMFGSCLVLGQIFGFAYFALSIFGFTRKSKQEEALLVQQFPNEYSQYKRRVKMLFPYPY